LEVTLSGLAGGEYFPLPASKGLAFPFLLTLDGYPTSPAIYAQGQRFSLKIKETPGKIRSTKFEIRNYFKIQIFPILKGLLDCDHLIFGFVSHFDIRISDLGCRFSGSPAIVQIMQVITGTLD